ncbi:hypothetical protein ScalyP_jg11664 [Parmales sp. scaly parma]|nr:hypothetical protein ScalyP_jg11664 [Parmales sp. scaly parma]
MRTLFLLSLIIVKATPFTLYPHPSFRLSHSHRSLSSSLQSIKGFQGSSFASSEVSLSPLAEFDLYNHLTSEIMVNTVCQQAESKEASYINGTLFQPVPYSPSTPHGMPSNIQAEFYLQDGFVVVNVPPTIMFKAKIFKPSRLCCVYQVTGVSPEEQERVRAQRLRVFKPESASSSASSDDSGGVWDNVGKEINEVWRESQVAPQSEEEEDFDFDSYIV